MLRIRVLGGLRLELDGEELPAPAGRPARALLGWLALHPGPHARADVAVRLWPDVLDASARVSLRSALVEVRRALGPGADELLVATRERLGLAGPPAVWVDALEADALLAVGRHAEAVALYGGDLLAGLDDGWVLAARDEHRERHGDALGALADAAAAAGDHAAALRLDRRRVALDPLAEPAQRALMRRLAGAGDRAGALAAYERLADRLRRELAVAPSAQTRALAQELRHDAVLAPAPAPSPPAAPVRPTLPPRLRAALGRGPFAGRGEPLARLLAVWEQACAGERRVALLAGEPGIGKTRLTAEAASAVARGGGIVLYGRAEADALAPYQAVAEALRHAAELRLLPDDDALAPLLPGRGGAREGVADGSGAGASLRLLDAVASALDAIAARRPLLVALDDLHWADRPTLRLLVRLATAPEPAAVLVLAAYRDTELPAEHPLADAIAGVARDAVVEHVRLRGLHRDAVAAVAARTQARLADRAIDRLCAATGGNPFFLHELLRDGGPGATVPAGARHVVRRRVAGLGGDAGELLTVAAVVGPEFDVDLVAEAAGVPLHAALDALEAAVRGGLLVEAEDAGGRYAFAHALVHEALVGELGAGRRAELRERVAAALEPRAEAEPDRHLAALAHHSLQAGAGARLARGVDVAARAARRMAAVHAHEEAAALLRRALAALDRTGGPPRRRAELLCALGDALQAAGDRAGARRAYDEATRVASAAGANRLVVRAALGTAGFGVTIAAVDHALVDRLEAALVVADDDAARARLHARLAIALAYHPDRRRSEAASVAAVAHARRDGDPAVVAAALDARHVALWRPEHARARLACATEMLGLARVAGDRALVLQARNWRVHDLFELGDGPGVRAELDAYAALAADVRLPAYAWYVPVWRAALAVLEGRRDDGIALGLRARDLGRRAGDANADVFWRELQHLALLADGRLGEDAQMLDYIRRQAERSPAAQTYRATLAWHLAAAGRDEEARGHLDAVAARGFGDLPRDMNWLPAMASAAQACAELGDPERAAQVRALLAPYDGLSVVSGRASGNYGSVAFLLARLAATAGDAEAADALYAEAATCDGRAGALVWVARDLRHHGELLLAHGAGARAQDVLARAEDAARAARLDGTLARIRAARAAAAA